MAMHTDNSVYIEAPLELVWERTNDIASWTGLFDEYAEATVLERDGDTVTFRLALHPDADGRVWSWVSRRTVDEATRTTRSHRVETGPFKYMHLFWEYLPDGDGVRMRWVQDFEMKASAPLGDAAMAERINRGTRHQQARIKRLLEEAALGAQAFAGV
ncbi:SRPBCC family protein [Streptomyces sp. NPDC089915]|uniref:SRPBCC family protein n=1 Tax=Streptomyces sp. NPDC089915 TaxID=3155186 RepID=UPI00341A6B2B